MASLDVGSLFTNVSHDKTIEICINELFKSSQTVSGLNKQQVLEMLSLTTKENVVLFDQKYYSQIDDVAIGSSLGPTLANIFLCYHETTWLKNCRKYFKPVYYKSYVHDIFVLFGKPQQVLRFVNYMNKRYKNIIFLFETKRNHSFSFLDVKIKTIKKILHKNAYRRKFFDKCIAKFFNNIFVQKPVLTTIPKLELRIVLLYLRNITSITKKRLNRCISKHLKFCKLKIIFQTGNRLENYFRFKDCVPKDLQSNFAYKFKCGSCTASYYGKTYRRIKFGFQNIGVSLLEQVNEPNVRYLRQ